MAADPRSRDADPACPHRAGADGLGPTAVSEHIDRGDGGSWQRWVFPGIWLFYLAQTGSGVAEHSHGVAAIAGYAILVAFGAVYLLSLAYNGVSEPHKYAIGITALCVMVVIEAFLAHEAATAMCVYIGVVCISGLGRWGWPAMGALTVLAVFGPAVVPSWHAEVEWDMAFTMAAVGLAMFGYFTILRSNRELSAARIEVARLAAENERTRIARDLHDLLGHSLTTITVKAALARRLVERDPRRAAQEIGEVEELTRTTLTDVRAAVAGYREITLAAELSTAHEVLRAAGIDAHTPRAIDIVPAAYRELFAWVVREGVTNVMRHSRAQVCTISVGDNWLEIVDDGVGGSDTAATGLCGLRERVDAAGGSVRAGNGALGGWTIRVELPSTSPSRESVDPSAPSPHHITRTVSGPEADGPAVREIAANRPGADQVAGNRPGVNEVGADGLGAQGLGADGPIADGPIADGPIADGSDASAPTAAPVGRPQPIR